jgi:hypothetical protein
MENKWIPFSLEYIIKSSPKILMSYISTPSGLSDWYADNVIIKDGYHQFKWDEDISNGKIITNKNSTKVVIEWMGEWEGEKTEMEIVEDEITNEIALVINDFCKPENLSDRKMIWDNQIDILNQTIGA